MTSTVDGKTVRVALLGCGTVGSEVARLLTEGDEEALAVCGLSPGDHIPDYRTIWKWMRGDLWEVKALNMQREGMGDRLQAAAVTIMFGTYRAAQVVMELMDKPVLTKEDKIRLDAAKVVLDKGAGTNIEKLARGAMSKAVDPSALETPEDIRAYELEVLRSGS